MNKIILSIVLLFLLITGNELQAQVSVNSSGNAPDGSAMLDVSSITKGVLIPRMTDTERDNIFPVPAGLIVYVTTDNHFYYYNGSSWQQLSTGDSDWTISGSNLISGVTGNVGIGQNAPSVKLDVATYFSTTDTVEDVFRLTRETTEYPAAGLGVGLVFANEVWDGLYANTGRISSVLESAIGSNSQAGMLFQTKYSVGMVDAMYINPSGFVGIGTRYPDRELMVYASNPGLSINAASGTSSSLLFEENYNMHWEIKSDHVDDNLRISSNTKNNLIEIDPNGTISIKPSANWRAIDVEGSESSTMIFATNSYNGDASAIHGVMTNAAASSESSGVTGRNYGTGYGVYGLSNNDNGYGVYGKNYYQSNFGYLGGGAYAMYGKHSSGSYAMGGLNDYGLYASLGSDEEGHYSIYGYGVQTASDYGTDYGLDYSKGGVTGFNYWGNSYTFGVAGYTEFDENRSGGTLGLGPDQEGDVWGCLGYKDSGGSKFGGYFTSDWSGSGKNSDVSINIGLASWGDLFGATIRGNIYGLFAEGKKYALYANGDVYHNGADIHLQKSKNNKNIPLYTMVSEEAMVQTCGYARLYNGDCSIEFDESFSQAVSDKEPIIVTLTPHGNTNGVFLQSVDKNGFTAFENNNGKSNVIVSYIAMGKRAGYEHPELSKEVVDADYTLKLEKGLHNDADTQTDGKGLYFENNKLVVGAHPLTKLKPNK